MQKTARRGKKAIRRVARVIPYWCSGRGECVGICPEGAIRIEWNAAVVDEAKCTGCGECVKFCTRRAIELVPARREESVAKGRG